MAVLSDNDRIKVWRKLQDDYGERHSSMALTKAQLRTAVNEIDDWVNTNMATAIAAITGTPSTVLTADEKEEVFFRVARQRWKRLTL